MTLPRRIPKQRNRSERWRSQADAALLRVLLVYKSGKLLWQPRARDMFPDQRSFATWNSRFAGQEAFTATHSEGYKVGRILGRMHFAHRVIWALHNDEAADEIDHINGDRGDNRIENLRAVSRLENRLNVKRQSNNKSGAVGVSRAGARWRASIQLDGQQTHLGQFGTFDEAADARKLAETTLGFHPNHGRP